MPEQEHLHMLFDRVDYDIHYTMRERNIGFYASKGEESSKTIVQTAYVNIAKEGIGYVLNVNKIIKPEKEITTFIITILRDTKIIVKFRMQRSYLSETPYSGNLTKEAYDNLKNIVDTLEGRKELDIGGNIAQLLGEKTE